MKWNWISNAAYALMLTALAGCSNEFKFQKLEKLAQQERGCAITSCPAIEVPTKCEIVGMDFSNGCIQSCGTLKCPAAPGLPTDLALAQEDNSMKLSWKAVEGEDVTYTVHRRIRRGLAWETKDIEVVPPQLAIADLLENNEFGTDLVYTVEAKNPWNPGSVSAGKDWIAIAPVEFEKVEGRKGLIRVELKPTAGALKYEYRYGVGAFTKKAEKTEVVADLTDGIELGKSHQVQVAASNRYHTRFSSVRMAIPYGGFSVTSANGSDQKISATWAKLDGATSYRLSATSVATGTEKSTPINSSTTLTGVVSGLTNGDKYTVRVYAIVEGKEVQTENAIVVMPLGKAVLGSIESNAVRTMKVNFRTAKGGSRYEVSFTLKDSGTVQNLGSVVVNADVASDGAQLSATKGDIPGGKNIEVQVVSKNDFLGQESSNVLTAQTFEPIFPPALASGNAALGVTWQKVAGAEKYRVLSRAGATGAFAESGDLTAATYNLASLVNGTAYQVKIAAINTWGRIESTEATETPVGTFDILAIQASDSKADLTWAALQGASAYDVYVKGVKTPSDRDFLSASAYFPVNAEKKATSAGTTVSVTGLTNGYEYAFYVVAKVGDKTVQSVSTKNATPLGTPVINELVVSASRALEVRWNKVAGATEYIVEAKSASILQVSIRVEASATAVQTATLSNLVAGIDYTVTVTAKNSTGMTVSAPKTGRTIDTLEAPTLAAADKKITATWKRVEGAESYWVSYRLKNTDAYTERDVGQALTTELSGLVNNQEYEVRYKAVRSNGSLYSPSAYATPIGTFMLTKATPASAAVTVEWSALDGATGYDLYYRVKENPGIPIKYGTDSGSFVVFQSNIQTRSVKVTPLTNGVTYEFKVVGKVDAKSVDSINTLSAKPELIYCDPFSDTLAQKGRGLKGKIRYWNFTEKERQGQLETYMGLYPGTTEAEGTLFLNQLNVPTRRFDTGFPAASGTVLQNAANEDLIEWFGINLESKLTIAGNAANRSQTVTKKYQLAMISDDGSLVSIQENGTWRPLAKYAGGPPHFVCTTETVTLKSGGDNALPIRVNYYQGPRYHIALMMLWREVPDGQSLSDEWCSADGSPKLLSSYDGDSDWYVIQPDGKPSAAFQRILDLGWKVIPTENFLTDNPCAE